MLWLNAIDKITSGMRSNCRSLPEKQSVVTPWRLRMGTRKFLPFGLVALFSVALLILGSCTNTKNQVVAKNKEALAPQWGVAVKASFSQESYKERNRLQSHIQEGRPQ
jgi:hypothetical protein